MNNLSATTKNKPATPLTVVQKFLARLSVHFLAKADSLQTMPGLSSVSWRAETENQIVSLSFANALLRDLAQPPSLADRPVQVAVLGPTQVGKSTVVNFLLGEYVADVSPLAGFTSSPCAFTVGLTEDDLTWLHPFFPGYQSIQNKEQPKEKEKWYRVKKLLRPSIGAGLTGPWVIWDTPDIDSLAARNYRLGVLEVAALADIYVLVLSPEKYSDLSVWKILSLLAPLKRPLVICLNKCPAEAEETIVSSLQHKLTKQNMHFPDMVINAIPRLAKIDDFPNVDAPESVFILRQQLQALIKRVERSGRKEKIISFLQTHWNTWTAPLVAEFTAAEEWKSAVQKYADEALTSYKRDYLNHPQRFDSFRQALVELLQLLEIPILAGTLSQVRHLLTWPARQLYKSRKTFLKRQGNKLVNEEQVLADAFSHLSVASTRFVLHRCDKLTPSTLFWQALNDRLTEKQEEIHQNFMTAVHHHHQTFQLEIQAAANRLYERLQQNPALLNTLRAARVTTDAAAIVLALKSAGLGFHDLLFAPALVSLISILTESALGAYMKRVAAELRERQFEAVKHQIFDQVLIPKLLLLPVELDDRRLFGITAEEFSNINQTLKAL